MTFIYLLLVLILVVLFFLLWRSKRGVDPDQLSSDFFNRFNEKFPELLKSTNEQLVLMANQKLGAEKQEISSDLANKKDAFEKLTKQILDELVKNQTKLEEAEKGRVGSFNQLREAIDNNRKITENLAVTADGLKKVLSNNQLRGQFGEKVAEDLLKMSGFVVGTDYTKQESTGESRPDFTLYLPDKTKINIDSKFPYANIVKMSETDDPSQKTQYLKLFEADVKKKISEVTSRDYINPEQNTVDFVILFIPNEMIFSFIYEKFPELLQEAISRKIVLAGPFSFTAILRMVRQAYDNFRYQANVQAIIGYIKTFEKEFEKYNTEFTKIGERIDSLSRQYNEVSSTRTNKLLRSIDKIHLEDSAASPRLPLDTS